MVPKKLLAVRINLEQDVHLQSMARDNDMSIADYVRLLIDKDIQRRKIRFVREETVSKVYEIHSECGDT